MQHQVVEEIVQTERQGDGGIPLVTEGFVDKDADFDPLVEGIVVVNVDAADGFVGGVEVNHQAQLMLAEQVVVSYEELLNLEAGVGDMCPADAPHFAVAFPSEDTIGVLWLGAT